jgi:NADH dehydrogenase (ubiquinone) flavoprotein 1
MMQKFSSFAVKKTIMAPLAMMQFSTKRQYGGLKD